MILLMWGSNSKSQFEINWDRLDRSWRNFLKSPTPENAKKVYLLLPKAKHINASEIHKHTATHDLIYYNLDVLEKRVKQLDENSVELTFRLFPISDGAFTEYLTIILGDLTETNPKLLLEKVLEHHHLRECCLGHIILNYGPDYYDNHKGSFYKTKKRIESMATVKEESLSELRDECIKMLEEYLSELKELLKKENCSASH